MHDPVEIVAIAVPIVAEVVVITLIIACIAVWALVIGGGS